MTPKERVDCGTLAAVYGEGAASYDTIWSPVILPAAEAMVDALDLSDARLVLDVGAGTGALTTALRDAAPNARIVGVDPSVAMLGYAREQRGTNATVADAMALPFPSAVADAVVLAYVLFHLPDPGRGLREAVRVVRAGGEVGTVTWAREWSPRAATVWDETLNELAVPALPAHGNHEGLDTTEAIDRLLVASSLRPQRVWYATVEHAFEPGAWWRMRTGGGMNRARLAAIEPATRARVLAELERRLAGLEPSDYVFRGELVCAVAVKALD